MYSARYLAEQIEIIKSQGIPLSEAVWNAALICVGWPYVFGAWGAECTVAERKKRYRDEHPTIRTACKAFDGGSCSGCKWLPDGERVRCFDCRGFTDYILKQFGIDLQGEGATSQWKTDSNWASKGKISDGMPEDTLVCLFYPEKSNPSKMAHTGFGYRGETCECSSGVQHFNSRKAKWTHWAVPKGISCGLVTPPAESSTQGSAGGKSTLRRGTKGDAVRELQTMLDTLGYDLGECGIDGEFGRMTQSAVMNFQSDRGITRDGICGPVTWAALIESAETFKPVKKELYSVTIPHLTDEQANALLLEHPGSYKKSE